MTSSSRAENRSARLIGMLQEPTVIFMVLTVLIFVVDALRPQPEEDLRMQEVAQGAIADNAAGTVAVSSDLSSIVVTDTLISSLQEEFYWLQGREPTAEEIEELVSEWIRDEMIFRHALSQNMHFGDAKMREHLIEKVSLLWAGMPDDPDEVEILGYYMDNIDFYYSEPRVSFSQVFYEQLPEDAEQILQRLRNGEDIAGDGYWMGDEMEGYGESIVRTSFGGEFYLSLVSAARNDWIGPLESPRGYHFVRVNASAEPAPLKFEQVYDRVRMDMVGDEQGRRIEHRLDKIDEEFTVTWDTGDE